MKHQPLMPGALSPQTRLFISLALIIHMFCATLGLLALARPSRFVADLHSKALAIYTQTLALDFNYDLGVAPAYLTQGTELDVDSILEIEIPSSPSQAVDWNSPTRETVRLVWPDVGVRGSNRHERYQNLARYITRFANDEQNQDAAPVLAQAVAERALTENGVADARIRVRRHLLQRVSDVVSVEEIDRDPFSAKYYYPATEDDRYFDYQARRDETGEVLVVQVTSARDVAPVRSRGGSSRP